MRRRVIVGVCVSVPMLAVTYLVYRAQVRCHRVVYGVFKVLYSRVAFAVNASFKSDFLMPPSRWTKD